MDTYKRNKASSIHALLLAERRRNEGVQEPYRVPLMRDTWQVWLIRPLCECNKDIFLDSVSGCHGYHKLSLQLALVNVGVSAGVAVEGDPKIL